MNLLKMYTPSLDRIYGEKLSHLRESFQTLLLTMDGVQSLLVSPAPQSEIRAKMSMMVGSAYRHFENEVTHMYKIGYEDIETHMDKHAKFINMLETFSFSFVDNDLAENVNQYRMLQKWVTSHLMWEDAHFVQTATSKK